LRSEVADLYCAIAIRAGGISHIAAQKPGFFNNTFANFMKRPHAKAWGYTNSRPPSRAEILTGCVCSLCLCSRTLKGVGFLTKVLFKKPGFLWMSGAASRRVNCNAIACLFFTGLKLRVTPLALFLRLVVALTLREAAARL
jgi:hypothetical protein